MEEGPKRNYIAEVLDAFMKERVTSNKQLAEDIGISWVTLNRLRRGEMPSIQVKTIQKLAAYFQWGPEEAGSAVWFSDQLVPRKERGEIRARRPKKNR